MPSHIRRKQEEQQVQHVISSPQQNLKGMEYAQNLTRQFLEKFTGQRLQTAPRAVINTTILIIVVIVYLLLAKSKKWWPFGGKSTMKHEIEIKTPDQFIFF